MPLDHGERLIFARDSLTGLSVGDAIGESLSYRCDEARQRCDFSILRPGTVPYTDDTAMALSVIRQLEASTGDLDADRLAMDFTTRFRADPDRGYGRMARNVLARIHAGENWRLVSSEVFGGSGSFGNGAAMRVPPLGAYHAGAPEEAARLAAISAQITHSHTEGIAGAIAVAVAASVAASTRGESANSAAEKIWQQVIAITPKSEVVRRLERARTMQGSEPVQVAIELGNGAEISAQDTVPFCIWNACRNLNDYREAILSAIEVDGDCDTNAAIVGGIVTAFTGPDAIPSDWLLAREPLPQ